MHPTGELTVIVRIQYKCHVPHAPIRESLLPVDSQVFETLACRIEIVDRNRYFACQYQLTEKWIPAYQYVQTLEVGHCHCGT